VERGQRRVGLGDQRATDPIRHVRVNQRGRQSAVEFACLCGEYIAHHLRSQRRADYTLEFVPRAPERIEHRFAFVAIAHPSAE
jgi:hypothetical protein